MLRYLGHIVSAARYPDNVARMRDFPVPKNRKQLKAALGLIGYYRRFIKGFAKIAGPLTDLTSLSCKFAWLPVHDEIYQNLMDLLCKAPILAYPDFERPFKLQTDASDIALGAVLVQLDDESRKHPVSFISRKLTKPETKWEGSVGHTVGV
jgi:hypothetical protein